MESYVKTSSCSCCTIAVISMSSSSYVQWCMNLLKYPFFHSPDTMALKVLCTTVSLACIFCLDQFFFCKAPALASHSSTSLGCHGAHFDVT